MKSAKVYTIEISKRGRKSETTGTLAELINYFSYTLEVGASWQHEKGNAKINRNPRTIDSLISNINNAKTNAAANGDSDTYYSLKTVEEPKTDKPVTKKVEKSAPVEAKKPVAKKAVKATKKEEVKANPSKVLRKVGEEKEFKDGITRVWKEIKPGVFDWRRKKAA